MDTKTNEETYLLNLLTALRCAQPETVAALVSDVNAMADRPWERDMTNEEVATAADAIYGFGCSLFGNEEFAAACHDTEVEQVGVVVTYSTRTDHYNVTFPSGKVKRFAMIQTAMRVAAEHAKLNKVSVEVKKTANDADETWARLFLSGQRN